MFNVQEIPQICIIGVKSLQYMQEVKNMRIQINLSDQILKRVDEEAKKIGVARGSMISTWVGEKINTIDQTKAMLQNIMNDPLTREFAQKVMESNLEKKGGQ